MKRSDMTRRSFVRGMSALAGLTSFAGCCGPAITKRRSANMLLSHACIGTGNMAWADLCGLKSHPDIHITALCDVDANYLAKAKAACPDARIYRNAFEMFEAEGDRIDSVNVSTPDHTHAQYVLEALRRGLHVYGQKPLCHELEDCRKIETLAAEKGVATQMGTQIAAYECDRQTVAAIKSGKIGEIRHVWLFSTRRGEPKKEYFAWPLKADPVPATLDWETWLGPAPYRPYSEKVYHPFTWRKWRDFGTSWLGDLGLHLMSPVWLGMELGKNGPTSVVAEVSDDDWTPEQRAQYWPSMSHLTWTFPGVKATGGKPFQVEWCDGFDNVSFRIEPKFLPPAFLQDIAARTPHGKLPLQGRVIEGTEGWILSTHYVKQPYIVLKNGKTIVDAPDVATVCSHWHEFVNCCLQGGKAQSDFGWTARMTEMSLMGNAAQLTPGKVRNWNSEKGVLA